MKDNQAKYPQLRFKGFTDPWEQRKLGEIAIRVQGNDGRMNLPTLTISAGNGWMDQRDRFSQNIAGKEQNNYTLLRQGELSYNHGNSKLAQFGAVFELESYNEALVPRVYHSFSVTAGAQPKFIEQMFATHRPDRELRKLVSSGARMDGLLNINYDDFMGIKVWLPSVAEQQAIAGLLVKLDNTITLHQRKLTKLKKLKQGYLQKLFPKNGSKFPQLRFAGFADDWEVRKLKDVLDISKTKNKAQQYGKVDVLSVSREVGTVNQIKYQGRSFAGSDLSNYKVVQGGELIYTKSPLKGAPYGIFQVATIKGILSPLYAVYTSTDKAYTPFVAMALKNDNIATHYLTPLVTKGAKNTINVTDEGALEGKIQFPSILEQKQIFIFFKQLDDTIALHQRKLDLLKEQKKGFLQKMFV